MHLRRSCIIKYLITAQLGAVLYFEWCVYLIQPVFWQKLECGHHDTTCTKILFIADPQIQGESAVSPPFSYLFNWDSDRYLKSTFSVALNYFKPDVLVYLGDLMDEGSIADMKQFHRYVKRLSNIFDIDYDVVQVWLPGDNDIGGENEPIRRDKVIEFDRVFDQPSVVKFKNISFYKVNGITHSYPKAENEDSNFRVVVSHYPITLRHVFARQVNNEIHPNVYFCAHEHTSKYIKQTKDLTNRQTAVIQFGDRALNIAFSDDSLYEIFVPTCSYRMGTSNMGYGAAILENNNQQMRYTVFWSPTRFSTLYFYLANVLFLCAYCIIFCSAKLFFKRVRQFKNENLPLLERI